MTMSKISAKRQITLPIAGCNELDIHPGDEVEIFRYKNQFNIIKKKNGAADAILKNLKVNRSISEQDSLLGNFD